MFPFLTFAVGIVCGCLCSTRKQQVVIIQDEENEVLELEERRSDDPAVYPLVKNEAGLGEECPICLEELNSSPLLALLPCGHPFHHSCLGEWLLRNPTCPMCRTELRVM